MSLVSPFEYSSHVAELRKLVGEGAIDAGVYRTLDTEPPRAWILRHARVW